MDQEITTCPQCGATVHAPARFCVTCGIKLPDTQPNHDNGEPVDPRAGWNSADMSGWTTPPPGAFEFEDPTIIEVEPISVTTVPPESRWASWPEQPERIEDDIVATIVEGVNEAEDELAEVATPVPIVSEAVDADVVATVAPFDHAEQVVDETVEVAAAESELDSIAEDESDELTAEITPTDAVPMEIAIEAVEEAVDVDVLAAPESEEEASDDFEAAGWTEAEEVDEGFAATADELPTEDDLIDEIAEEESPVAVPNIERANALLDELRAILPVLAAGFSALPAVVSDAIESTPEPIVDLDAIKMAAVDARGEISFDNFSALRTTIDEAMNKPRDVEVMLKLSQRVDDIVALIAERDRLQLGFDVLIERLGDGAES